jgi:hypothetical protein
MDDFRGENEFDLFELISNRKCVVFTNTDVSQRPDGGRSTGIPIKMTIHARLEIVPNGFDHNWALRQWFRRIDNILRASEAENGWNLCGEAVNRLGSRIYGVTLLLMKWKAQ